MAAFASAVELGYSHVETDVHATADGVAVAFHDARLDRVTDLTGKISELPWSEVKRARIGGVEPVPTLAEVLQTWPNLRLNIDIKAVNAIRPTVEVVERLKAHDRVLIGSFSDRRRRAALAGLTAPVATSGGTSVIARFLLATRLRRPAEARRALTAVDCIQVPQGVRRVRVVDEVTVAAAHAAGVQMHVWTINDAEQMHRLLDLGVDGLVTDRADVLRDVLRERGQWHPATSP